MPKKAIKRSDITDERVLALVVGNDARGVPIIQDGVIPRAWRAQGYEPTAVLITEYYLAHPEPDGTVRTVSASALRNYWKIDLERGYSSLVPPPDCITKRGLAGELLPGWAPETVIEWLPYRQGPGNHTRGETRKGNDRGRAGRKLIDGVWINTRAKVEPVPV